MSRLTKMWILRSEGRSLCRIRTRGDGQHRYTEASPCANTSEVPPRAGTHLGVLSLSALREGDPNPSFSGHRQPLALVSLSRRLFSPPKALCPWRRAWRHCASSKLYRTDLQLGNLDHSPEWFPAQRSPEGGRRESVVHALDLPVLWKRGAGSCLKRGEDGR